jgi:hypothetical protein
MVDFKKIDNKLILEYEAESPINWLWKNIKIHGFVRIFHVFYFAKDDIYQNPEDEIDEIQDDSYNISFVVAVSDGNYYKFEKRILGTSIDVYFDEKIDFRPKFFRAERNISVFKKIDRIVHEDIYIGDSQDSNLPVDEFNKLINQFPNSYELDKYSEARISTVIDTYFDQIDDAKDVYEKYLNKKESRVGQNLVTNFKEYEVDKYSTILGKLNQMLQNQNDYNEKQWQREINQILLLIFPKYIALFEEVPVKDYYADTMRSIDFMLLDSNGTVDIVEIKKPFESR